MLGKEALEGELQGWRVNFGRCMLNLWRIVNKLNDENLEIF